MTEPVLLRAPEARVEADLLERVQAAKQDVRGTELAATEWRLISGSGSFPDTDVFYDGWSNNGGANPTRALAYARFGDRCYIVGDITRSQPPDSGTSGFGAFRLPQGFRPDVVDAPPNSPIITTYPTGGGTCVAHIIVFGSGQVFIHELADTGTGPVFTLFSVSFPLHTLKPLPQQVLS